jgi:type IV secretion system protein VirB9
MRRPWIIAIAALIPALVPGWAAAQVPAAPTTNTSAAADRGVEGRIEQFVYHPNRVFHIRARVGSFTNIEVPSDEVIEGFYLSDTTFWRFVVAKDQARVLVKPGEPGVTNSGTLVTNKRVYELSFRSVPDGEPWHQRVQWDKTKDEALAWGVFEPFFVGAAQQGVVEQSTKPAASSLPVPKPQAADEVAVDAARVRFRWRIQGDAPFRPSVVFDDGKFTYIRMPDVQDYPALFVEDAGKVRVVDYVVKNGIIIVHRISDAILMRLENQVVRIERDGV